MSNLGVIEDLLHSYFSLNRAGVLNLVTDDFLWLNMALPKATVQGVRALEAKLSVPNLGLPIPLEEASHETLEQLEQGHVVMHERIDRLRFRGQWLHIPCAAVFHVRSGRVALWKDYYDIGVVLRFMRNLGVEIDTSSWW